VATNICLERAVCCSRSPDVWQSLTGLQSKDQIVSECLGHWMNRYGNGKFILSHNIRYFSTLVHVSGGAELVFQNKQQ
jgi:hypothetical protein